MAEGARKIRGRERAQQRDPACVQTVQKLQRDFHWRSTGVRQLGPKLLLVGAYRRLGLRERQAQAYVAVHVAIGDVMHGLPHGPSTGTVRRIELLRIEAPNRVAE